MRLGLCVLLAWALTPAQALAQERGDTQVRVIGPGERGLARTPLVVETSTGEAIRTVATDSDGVAVLRDVLWDGSLRVAVLPLLHAGLTREYRKLWKQHRAVIDGPKVVLRSGIGLPVRLEPVDAHTGKRVRGATWKTCFASMHKDLVAAAEDGPQTLFIRPGDRRTFHFRVMRAPDGYIAADPERYEFRASRFATSFVARHPLRPEARVRLKFTGSARAGRIAYGFRTALRVGPFRLAPREADGVRIRGVPFYRSEPLSVIVTDRIRTGAPNGSSNVWIDGRRYEARDVAGAALVSGRLPTDPRDKLVLAARLPSPEAPAIPWLFAIPSGSGGGVRGGGPRPPGPYAAADGPELVVRAVRRNGQPATGAKVVIRYGVPVGGQGAGVRHEYVHADASGMARFRGVPGGRVRFLLAEPGLVRTWSGDVEVRAGHVTVLKEGDGGSLVVRVVDHRGKSLACARIRAETYGHDHARGPIDSWTDPRQEVQRIDPFASETGSRTFPHVTPGQVRVKAWWLDRIGVTTVTVREGQAAQAVVVVRVAKR